MSDSRIPDFTKDLFKVMKYTNLNANINQDQADNFAKLFGGGKEHMAFLLLRIMNLYAATVSNNYSQYEHDSTFKKYVADSIYNKHFLNSINNLSSQPAYENQSNKTDDDADDDCELPTVPTNVEFNKLREYFDTHFSRQNENVIYICTFRYTQFNQIYTDEYLDYLNYSNGFPHPSNSVTVYIDDNFYKFIDVMMSHQRNPSRTFWSDKRRNRFHNYIANFQLCKSFQNNCYKSCYVRYSDTYGCAYEWNIESGGIIPLELGDKFFSEIHLVHKPSSNLDLSKFCLNVHFSKPKSKSKMPNKDLIKAYLSYFTMNDPDVLDALALDFVNSVLCTDYKHKNTLVTGDYDKFYKWKNLFGFGNNSMPLPVFFNDGVRPDKIECYTHEKDEKHIVHLINMFDENTNAMVYVHRYLLINRTLKLTKSYLKKVNQIDFPYGGEYYNPEPITDIERVEIIKLLIVHGWHLLNSKLTEKPNIMENNTNIFYKYLKNTDESRIPLNILHQIYSRFITDGKTDTQLQKELTEAGFKYDSMDIRNKDQEYLDALVEQAKKISLNLERKPTKSQRSVSCKIDPKFWDEISPEIKKENELTRAAEFELYLKSLSEKYAKFYDVKLPEPEEDPLKDFVPPEKIPDDLLQ